MRELTPAAIAAPLLHWYDQHGRKDLPWQQPRTAYRVWVSEVMLQQTQVQTASGYFLRFMERFPSLPSLAAAPQDAVMAAWSGLGYYTRARNLQRAAQICVAQHGGELPTTMALLQALPGIGRSTAAAILAQAHGHAQAILDANVRRVLARHFRVSGDPASGATRTRLWQLAEDALPKQRLADYTQALMDLGALICRPRQPLCGQCPLSPSCTGLRFGDATEYPQRKAPRMRRSETRVWLLAQDCDGRLLLQRRPPLGIWAGLWSPLEATDLSAALAQLRNAGIAPVEAIELDVVRHALSHFTVELQCYLLPCASDLGVADEQRRWLTREQALALGLPQPARRLLEQLPQFDQGVGT